MDPYPPDDMPPDGWFRVEDDLVAMLDTVLDDFRADAARVYLTGLSYGGFGTFDLAARYPQRFAAIAPIVGTGSMDDAQVLADAAVPIWRFGGGADPVVKPHWFYAFAAALEKAGHPELRFTVQADMSHDAWIRVYAGWDLYDWFLSHRLGQQ